MKFTFKTENETETAEIGRRLGKLLMPGDMVLLCGDLGAGKTHFTGGIAQGLGIETYVTSPTFTIVNVYEGGRMPLIHFDIYRLQSFEELFEIGFEDYLLEEGVFVVEWADRIPEAEAEGKRIIRVTIQRRDDVSPTRRDITVILPEGMKNADFGD